jgi:hypothetical protein
MEKGDFCIFFETGSMKGRFLMILLVAGLGARGQVKNDTASLAATANLSSTNVVRGDLSPPQGLILIFKLFPRPLVTILCNVESSIPETSFSIREI